METEQWGNSASMMRSSIELEDMSLILDHRIGSLMLERFRLGSQYLYRYLNLSFSQSVVSDLHDKPIKLFKIGKGSGSVRGSQI